MTRLVLVAILLVGCGQKKEEPAPAPTGSAQAAVQVDAAQGSAAAGSAAAGSAAAGSSAGSAAQVDVPTATDFEGQADKDITDKNVEARVKQMETDLGQ